MLSRSAFVFAIFLTWPIHQSESLTSFTQSSCHDASMSGYQGAVVGGRESPRNKWPWLVALVYKKNEKFFGAGTLISERFVLTAAHCLQSKREHEPIKPEDVKIYLGKWNLSDTTEPNAVEATIEAFIIHDDWNVNHTRWNADIAIVKLANNVTFSRSIKPVCLWTSQMQPHKTDDGGTVVGWGRTEHQRSEKHSDVPREAELHGLPIFECYENADLGVVMSRRALCVGGNGRGPCNGDSGGGFFTPRGGKWFLRGITSLTVVTNFDECDVAAPAVFTNVEKFTYWIDQVLNGDEQLKCKYYSEAQSNEDINCQETHRRFYFDRRYGVCLQFCCNGSGNNFETREECDNLCTRPMDSRVRPTQPQHHYPEVSASTLEGVPEEFLRPVYREGEAATLKCTATGSPPASITWLRGGIELKTNQGRFLLSSSGDLQIVQLQRTDAGTYVCVAFNGIGNSIEREVKLTVDEPMESSAYIVNDTYVTVLATIAQPAILRCLAGGHPKPFVTWWRGNKILEITDDYSLVINRVDIFDLGPYVCQAHNSIGRPVSIEVTLKARGPVPVQTEEEKRYQQYIENNSIPETTQRPRSQRPTLPPRPRPSVARSSVVPLKAEILLPKGRVHSVGTDISLHCNVTGEPTPDVTWYKDSRQIEASNHVEFPEPNRIIVIDAQVSDSGNFRCVARNDYSQTFAAEVISVDVFHIPSDCTDNRNFANCALIVKGNYCNHIYYGKLCCRSCTLAGQL